MVPPSDLVTSQIAGLSLLSHCMLELAQLFQRHILRPSNLQLHVLMEQPRCTTLSIELLPPCLQFRLTNWAA